MQEILLGLGLKRTDHDGIPFKGEIFASPELLGTAIASQIGLTNGTVQNDDAGWLVYDFEGKTLLIAKRTFRSRISWDHLNTAGVIYGDREITLNGLEYKVRLLKGTNPNSTDNPDYSEWNKLLYPLIPEPVRKPDSGISIDGVKFGEWGNYTEIELNLISGSGNGYTTWCQEVFSSDAARRVTRGGTQGGVVTFGNSYTTATGGGLGWRPVLELVRTTSEPQDLFLGEVSTDQLITGDALATQIGLTAGTAFNSTEPWLQFLTKEGQILYVSKKPYRHSISWDQIDSVNAVYGDREITVGEKRFKVRLLKGTASDPISGGTGYDPSHSWGSEWNRLFYPLVPNPTNKPDSGISGEGLTFGSWAEYTEDDLVVHSSGGNGDFTWCQESSGSSRVLRGDVGLSYFSFGGSFSAGSNRGWRPVLELIP